MIGDDIRAALPELRQQAESLMGDTIQVVRPSTATPVLNTTTGKVTKPAPTVLYEGKARFRLREANGSVIQLAEQDVSVVGLLVDLPFSFFAAKPGDEVLAVASEDPRITGKSFPITAIRESTPPIKRVLVVIDNQG